MQSTKNQLSTKQIDIIMFLLKLRAATIFHIIHYLNPELKGKDRHSKEYENARKSVSKILKRLQNAGYIRIKRPDDAYKVYYYLTAKGQYKAYDILGIEESDTNKSGFDFDLGYIPREKFTTPTERNHARFQTDVQAYLMWLNEAVAFDSEEKWRFGDVQLTNICSFRDTLYSAPRESKGKDDYRPDGEIRFNCSRYNENSQLISPEGDTSHYFLEHDLISEYGLKLEWKFDRLLLRLRDLKKLEQHHLYKGMIVVLPGEEKKKGSTSADVKIRYKGFVDKFKNVFSNQEDRLLAKNFNIIASSINNLDKTLLSLRTEYTHTFFNRLKESWKFPTLSPTFYHNESKVITLNPERGDTFGHFTKDMKCLCMFINIEGLNTLQWEYAVQAYNDILRAYGNNKYRIIPIVTFSHLMPYAPQQIGKHAFNVEEIEFFKNLYLLDLRISGRPILYRDNQPIDFEEAEFLLEF